MRNTYFFVILFIFAVMCVFMKKIRVFGLLAILALSATDCNRDIVVGDFTATLRIVNIDSVVNSGDMFRWVVECNTDSYRLVSVTLDERIVTSFPTFGKTYASGEELSHAVTVLETHRGKLEVTVQDPVTSMTKVLSAMYTAYDSPELKAALQSDVLDDGGALVLRVYSRHSTVQVLSVSSPYDFQGLTPGSSVNVGSSGFVDFSTGAVHVLSSGVFTVKVRLQDPESGQIMDFSQDFTARKETVISMALLAPDGKTLKSVRDGDDVVIRVYDTQESFVCEEFDCEFDNNVFRVGTTYKVGYDGYYQARINKVSVGSAHSGRVFLVVSDPVFGKKHRLECEYVTLKD